MREKLSRKSIGLAFINYKKKPPQGGVSSCEMMVKFSSFNAAAICSKTALISKVKIQF